MRIIAGRYKGRRLSPVPDPAVRSTADRVRESLFNILMHDTPHAVVLDLFCGAGTLGLEALSRGADSVVFVDSSRRSLQQTLENARQLDLTERIQTSMTDALTSLQMLARRGHRFSLIFADPPYGNWAPRTLGAVAAAACRAEEGVLVIEHHKKDDPGPAPQGFSLWTQRRFGDTVLTFWRWKTTGEVGTTSTEDM